MLQEPIYFLHRSLRILQFAHPINSSENIPSFEPDSQTILMTYNKNETIRFAVQKDGRLTLNCLDYLNRIDLDTSGYDSESRRFHYRIPDSNVEIIFLRYWDIFEFLEKGHVDYAFVSGNTLSEFNMDKAYTIWH